LALALLGDRSAAGDRAVEEVAGQNSPRVPDGAVAHDYFDSGSRARIEIRSWAHLRHMTQICIKKFARGAIFPTCFNSANTWYCRQLCQLHSVSMEGFTPPLRARSVPHRVASLRALLGLTWSCAELLPGTIRDLHLHRVECPGTRTRRHLSCRALKL